MPEPRHPHQLSDNHRDRVTAGIDAPVGAGVGPRVDTGTHTDPTDAAFAQHTRPDSRDAACPERPHRGHPHGGR